MKARLYNEDAECFATRGARVLPNGGFGCCFQHTTSTNRSHTLALRRPSHKQLIAIQAGRRPLPVHVFPLVAILEHDEATTWKVTFEISYDEMPLCA